MIKNISYVGTPPFDVWLFCCIKMQCARRSILHQLIIYSIRIMHLADDDEAVSTLGKQNGSSQISNQCLVVSVGGVVVKPFVMVFWWSRVSHFGTILSM